MSTLILAGIPLKGISWPVIALFIVGGFAYNFYLDRKKKNESNDDE